ncbi:MAG: hypothetical protein GKR89_08470 [Candidatus Latescibacteria bacterium]|nr:hypothetical protein [Candidatus Latescibacterota bacterium]
MIQQELGQACFNCGQDEEQSPLIGLRYHGRGLWICPACMPVLIHEGPQLAQKLAQIKKSES